MGSALCVMGGRLWFLSHTCSSYMCTGSALDVMDYGLAKAKDFSNELAARTLLILHIIVLGLILQRFLHRNTTNCINMHMSTFIHIHKCLSVPLRVLTTLFSYYSMFSEQIIGLCHRRPSHRIGRCCRPASSPRLPPHLPATGALPRPSLRQI